MQSCRVPMTFLLALLSGVTVAHDGIMHHPETHSELAHFAAHLWMAVPVASLQHGDVLQGDQGELIRVQAAPETVSTLTCDDPWLLARACYHLGNRHVPVQIMQGMIRYQHDHVLDEMLHGLGLHVVVEQAPFEPEAGAYGGGHSHSHDH